MRPARLLCAVAIALAPATAIADGAADWLLKVSEAARQANYQGTVVYRDGQRMDVMRLSHRLHEGRVIAGFAGGTADAFTLFERFEAKLQQFGNLTRAAIELAKDWRSDRSLRRLEALLCVADATHSLIISGNGDVIEPENDLMAVGSGGPFAQAAALALLGSTELDARAIVERALGIAADICIYTNRNVTIEELG